jgi:hypothetical protein
LLLSCGTYDNTLRWIPPLNVTAEQINDGLNIFGEALKESVKLSKVKSRKSEAARFLTFDFLFRV